MVSRLRILPRSLAGWSLLILINVLLLMCFAQLISLQMVSRQVSNFVERDTIADRVYVMDRMFRSAPQSEWPKLAKALDEPGFHVTLTPPEQSLYEERVRERPIIDAAGLAWTAWQEAKRSGKEPDTSRALALLAPLQSSEDPLIAEAARTATKELATVPHSDCCMNWASILERIAAIWSPNTAVFVPAFTSDMPFPITAAMEFHVAHLRQGSGPEHESENAYFSTLYATQRISPFVRAWYGQRFDERPYLLRSPIDNKTLRVVLPASADQWITIDAGTAEGFAMDLQPMLLGFLLAGIVITVLAGLAIMRLTAPLGRFSEATERLGHDVNADPLPVKGPAEVRRAAAAFNEMQARIQAYVRDRTTMLAAISHDLRTPLTRLRLRGEFMSEDQQARYYRDLDEMETMIASAMEFAQDEAKIENAEPVDLRGLAKDVAAEMTEAGKPVTCRAGSGPLVTKLRPIAFKRALTNLIENALAYGHAARLEVAESKQAITVIVDDDGPGIPDDQLERVFAPFYRLEGSRNRSTGGAGLGLASARSILRSLGGDVTLTNRAEGGLRAIIALPR